MCRPRGVLENGGDYSKAKPPGNGDSVAPVQPGTMRMTERKYTAVLLAVRVMAQAHRRLADKGKAAFAAQAPDRPAKAGHDEDVVQRFPHLCAELVDDIGVIDAQRFIFRSLRHRVRQKRQRVTCTDFSRMHAKECDRPF